MDFVAFYLGKGPDHQGRMLEEILRWSDDKLEASHDYIQVLFPLAEPSQHIPNAPTLDAAALAEFRSNAAVKKNLLRALAVMLRFYGFGLGMEVDRCEIAPAADFRAKADHWLFLGDHNHLRITRILKCLSSCGLAAQAAAFLEALLAIADPSKVSELTRSHWRRAVLPNRETESSVG